MASLDEIRNERIKKLNILKDAGLNPYPSKSERDFDIAEILEKFKDFSKKKVTLGGRVMALRKFGGSVFADLNDGSSSIQIYLKKEMKNFDLFGQTVDIGDILEVKGTSYVTEKGENTILVSDWKMLTKSLRPLPEKWHGLQDVEARFRQRYLDLLLNPELRKLFIKKEKFWEAVREFMKSNGFLEVETPTLEITTGGAEATPFKTHHEDFDIDVYLRISVGELWQKRLMAAGFEKTFEIGRAYRNEGSSPNHLQEFTNMEFYWAYVDYRDGMELTKKLCREAAKKSFGKTKFTTRGHTFDLADKWKELDYIETVKKATGVDVLKDSDKVLKEKLDELKIKYDGQSRERLTDSLWKHTGKQISGPAFVINHPKIVSPLSKEHSDNPELTERFQILIAGSELGNGYSELNNPIEQKKRFDEQKKLLEGGDTIAMMSDDEFVEMLEHGMPPTCGFGFGERLFAFMADMPIRDTQLFPLMKPKGK
jgi:lysyl-tRNA synthetase class 2